MSDERKISARYRSLSREEPPRHLDEAILAAARRAAGTRPAPLVVPTGRQRWYFPLAAAAIIVLAVAVTMHVEREQPDPEARVVAPATTPEPAAKEQVFAPDPKPAPSKKKTDDSRELRAQREGAPPAQLQKASPPAAAPPASLPAPEVERRAAQQDAISGARARSDVQSSPGAEGAAATAQMRREAGAVANFAVAPPDQVLQGIADLRRQGRHDEADKALAEFRKRYPDYKISEEIRAKVERR